jgi:hypothetical protein
MPSDRSTALFHDPRGCDEQNLAESATHSPQVVAGFAPSNESHRNRSRTNVEATSLRFTGSAAASPRKTSPHLCNVLACHEDSTVTYGDKRKSSGIRRCSPVTDSRLSSLRLRSKSSLYRALNASAPKHHPRRQSSGLQFGATFSRRTHVAQPAIPGTAGFPETCCAPGTPVNPLPSSRSSMACRISYLRLRH